MPNDEICGLNGRVIGINKNHAIIQCFRGTVIVYPYCMLKDCPELNDALSLGDRVAFRAKIQGTSHSRMTAIKGSVMVMSDAYATGSGYVKFVKQDLYGSGSDDGEYGFISVDKIDTERLPDEIDSDVFFHRTALGSECNDISDILSVGSEVYFVAKRAPPNASTKFSALWVSPVNRNAGKISDRVNSAFETMQRKFGVSSDGEKTLNLADGRGDESGDSVELDSLDKCQIAAMCKYKRQNETRHKSHTKAASSSYSDRADLETPEWREDINAPYSAQWKPTYNFAPSSHGPILLYDHHRMVRSLAFMRWGLVPNWFKGSTSEFKAHTINARCETLMQKSCFSGPLAKGQRCVVLADGYYEWAGPKCPYFVYFPDYCENETSQCEDKCEIDLKVQLNSDCQEENESRFYFGKHLLTMAGLYDIAKDGTYTYTVITVPASEKLSWLHDRMPAVLPSEHAVSSWLDAKNVAVKQALEILKPDNDLCWCEAPTKLDSAPVASCLKSANIKFDEKPSAQKRQTAIDAFFAPAGKRRRI